MIRRAVTDTEKGMGSYDAEITEEAVDFLADMSEGRCETCTECS